MNKKLEVAIEGFHQDSDEDVAERQRARVKAGAMVLLEKFKDDIVRYFADAGGDCLNIGITVYSDGRWGCDGQVKVKKEEILEAIFKNHSQEIH